jgi:hypothetical protein
MAEYALWYTEQGLHALVVTLGGYGHSEAPRHGPSEGSSYLDADAALRWLRAQGCPGLPRRRVVAHGLSLGGAWAAALAASHPGVHATLDQTFASAAAVARHVATAHLGAAAAWAADAVAAAAVPDLSGGSGGGDAGGDAGGGGGAAAGAAEAGVVRGHDHHPTAFAHAPSPPPPARWPLDSPSSFSDMLCSAGFADFMGLGHGDGNTGRGGGSSDGKSSRRSRSSGSSRRSGLAARPGRSGGDHAALQGLREEHASAAEALVAAAADADVAEAGDGCARANRPCYVLDG